LVTSWELEWNRFQILRWEEETWRIRSRAQWIKCGDNNTKYFHKMAKFNRNRKHVWEITNSSGVHLTDQGEIKKEAVNHFKLFFEAKSEHNINDLAKDYKSVS
jgi:hypothetical protein